MSSRGKVFVKYLPWLLTLCQLVPSQCEGWDHTTASNEWIWPMSHIQFPCLEIDLEGHIWTTWLTFEFPGSSLCHLLNYFYSLEACWKCNVYWHIPLSINQIFITHLSFHCNICLRQIWRYKIFPDICAFTCEMCTFFYHLLIQMTDRGQDLNLVLKLLHLCQRETVIK